MLKGIPGGLDKEMLTVIPEGILEGIHESSPGEVLEEILATMPEPINQ